MTSVLLLLSVVASVAAAANIKGSKASGSEHVCGSFSIMNLNNFLINIFMSTKILVQGVNVGGWLLIEEWMFSAGIFDKVCHAHYSLC